VRRATHHLALVALVCACDSTGYRPTNPFTASVVYDCAGPSDPVCDGVLPAVPPDPSGYSQKPRIAVGALFYGASSLAPDRIALDQSGTLQALLPGVAAVTDGVSFEHLLLRAPDHAVITHESDLATQSFDDVVGTDTFALRLPTDRFRAVVVDADGVVLAGALQCHWESSDTQVVTVETNAAANLVTLRLVGSGMATVTVTMGGLTAGIDFDVTIQ
jgi:hypothetical protein